MKTLTLKNRFQTNATLLPNDFIDNYMVDANGEFVKVYLFYCAIWMIRVLRSRSPRLPTALIIPRTIYFALSATGKKKVCSASNAIQTARLQGWSCRRQRGSAKQLLSHQKKIIRRSSLSEKLPMVRKQIPRLFRSIHSGRRKRSSHCYSLQNNIWEKH